MNQVDELMALAKEYRDAIDEHGIKRQALRQSLEAALKPGEPALFIDPDTLNMPAAHVGAWKPGHELEGYIPLYTAAPPRREPLTNQQVKEMWRKHAPNIGGIFDFAAEIQQYHGIGGKEVLSDNQGVANAQIS